MQLPDLGAVFVVSGPSGVGKSTLLHEAMRLVPGLRFSVSATTRPPRTGEKQGIDYHFLTTERFEELIEQDAFIEYAKVYDRYYGTLKEQTDGALSRGISLILDIDVQGAEQVRNTMADSIHIYILPPSIEALKSRLQNRGTDDPSVINRRMAGALEQMQGAKSANYLVINDDLSEAHRVFQSVLIAEMSRRERRQAWIDKLLPTG